MLNADLRALSDELKAAGHGMRQGILQRHAVLYGVSVHTLYRALRRKFGKQKTLNREQKVPQNLIDMIADLKLQGMSLSLDERELSTELCIQALQERGIEGAEQLTVATVNRRLKEAGFRIRDPRVRVEPAYANQEHQLDFSRSKYFQVTGYDSKRDDYILTVSGRELHYKKDDRRMRTWICQVKESKSRCQIARAYAATSEDGFIGLDMLNWMWNRPEDAHPLRHVPERLKTDSGSFQKRKEVRAAMEALDILFKQSKPYNKESQGKVESGFRNIWQRFELRQATLLGAGKTIYLSEYNDLLHEFFIADMKRKHPVDASKTREQVYRMSILAHPPRQLDTDVLRIACHVERRHVPATLMIQYDSEKYEAPVYASGKWVRVYKNMNGELMAELEEEDRRPFFMKPYRYRALDDFTNRPHQTYKQYRETQLSPPFEKGGQGGIIYMPPKPTTIEPDSPFIQKEVALEFPSVYAAKVYIGEQLRRFGQTYADYEYVFEDMLKEDLSKAAIDTVIGQIKQLQKAVGF